MDKQTFYVTFGCGHPLAKYYIVIKCKDWTEVYNIVLIQFARYGEIYSQSQWDTFLKQHGETMDVHYGLTLAAVIDNYKYVCNYKDYKD